MKVSKTSGILEGQKLKTPEKLVQTNVFSPLFTQILGFLPHFFGVRHNNPVNIPLQAKSGRVGTLFCPPFQSPKSDKFCQKIHAVPLKWWA